MEMLDETGDVENLKNCDKYSIKPVKKKLTNDKFISRNATAIRTIYSNVWLTPTKENVKRVLKRIFSSF